MNNTIYRKFKPGHRVCTTMGCLRIGTVVPKFWMDHYTDGQYREPYDHEKPVWVHWDDGTKGWIHMGALAFTDISQQIQSV